MLISARDLTGWCIETVDGFRAPITDLLFDDWVWTVRYLSVNVKRWLGTRPLLVSPAAIRETVDSDNCLRMNLTKAELLTSPNVDRDKPVSRQKEELLARHFNWPFYWTALARPTFPDEMSGDMTAIVPPEPLTDAGAPAGDPHLQSLRSVVGLTLATSTGAAGELDDFLVDDEVWALRNAVVRLFSGDDVILPSEWIGGFDWERKEALTRLDRAQVEQGPVIDHARERGREE